MGDHREADGGAGAPLLAVLPRLSDPATSTRRTAAARARLAAHPTTRALLDAGVRVLLEELGAPSAASPAAEGGGGADDAVPARFFELLSASRVCAAATAVGPLQVTPSHLRDRWARQADYAEDLFAFALWRRHWVELLTRRLGTLVWPSGPQDLPRVAEALARACLLTPALPVTSRLEVMASVLAPVHPRSRATRTSSYDWLDARWASVLPALLRAVGRQLAPEVLPGDTARAVVALAEGANVRLLALGESPQRREEAVRLLSTGVQGLLLGASRPAPPSTAPTTAPTTAPSRSEPSRPAAWPAPGPGAAPEPGPDDLADVLVRLTHEVTGTRRTEEARRRLAHDGITRQLLDAGLGVLGQELGVASLGPARRVALFDDGAPSRFFDVLSAARVLSEARAAGGDGAGVTPGQLRDRWATQEHYVDDLVSYAVAQMRSTVAPLMAQVRRPEEADLERAVHGLAPERLRGVEESAEVRLRLLLTTLARARPVVAARLAQLAQEEEDAVRGVVELLLRARGQRLRPDVDVDDLCRALVAVGEGTALRVLATGRDGPDDDGSRTQLLRSASTTFRGALLEPPEA